MATLTAADIDRLRASTEHRKLEFKAARNNFDRETTRRYCVAIANELGGHLILGIDNATRNVVGTQAFLNLTDIEFWLFTVCKFRVEVQEVAHSDGRVVVFQIPPRPLGIAYDVDGAYLMRSGESLVAMTFDRLKEIASERAPHWTTEFSRDQVAGQDVINLLDTQSFFELLQLPYPTTQQGVLDRLVAHHLLLANGSSWSITRLAALLLAKRLPDFPDVARHAPRVVVYTGDTKKETRQDIVGSRGYAVGFQALVRYVMEQMPRRELVQDSLRREETLVPEIAVRELVANALVHQDLTLTGVSPMVEIYADRVEVSSPGEPIVEANRFIDGYQSRNENLATLMRLFRICEEKGSGIDRVVMEVETQHLPPPDFRIGPKRTHVIMFGPRDFSEMTPEERIRAAFQHCALRWVNGDYMTNQTLRERLRLDEAKSSAVSSVISATIDAGLVKADTAVGGSKKFARYLPFWA